MIESADGSPVPQAVPEPATIAMVATGLGWLIVRRRRATSQQRDNGSLGVTADDDGEDRWRDEAPVRPGQ